jgi:hypothetical protein
MDSVYKYLKIAVKYAAIFTILGEVIALCIEKMEFHFPELKGKTENEIKHE